MRQASRAGSGLEKALTLLAMSLGFCVVQLDVTIVNVALNDISGSFREGVAALQWVVNAYTVAFAALILSAGALGDRVGAKRVFMAGFVVFTAASIGCGLAPTIGILIGCRLIQGIGAAILVPNSLALLSHAYKDLKARRRAVAVWAAGASLALTAGPLIGGGLISAFGWRSIFFVNVPIGLAGLGLAWRYAVETPKSADRGLDVPGSIAAILALGALAGALIRGGQAGWSDAYAITGIGVFLAALASFIVIEHRTASPMLPLSLFKIRNFSVTSAAGLLINSSFYGLIFVLSLYFQRSEKLNPLATGMAFLPMMAAVFLANLTASSMVKRVGTRPVILAGTIAMFLGSVLLLGLSPGGSRWLIAGAFTFFGAGLGLIVPPLTSALLESVQNSRAGVASGVLNSMRQIGSVFGVALLGSLVEGQGGPAAGLHIAAAISSAVLLASAALVFLGL